MATVLGLNCASDRRNIGIESCAVPLGQKRGHIQVPIDWSLNITTETFNKEYVNSKIQDGSFKIIANAYAVTTETAEDTTEESTSGQLSVVRKGLPIVSTTIKKGSYEGHAGYFDMSGEGIYAVLEIYDSGVIAAVVSKDGTTISGCVCGMYEVGTFKDNDGSTSSSTMIKYQLIDVAQYNKDRVFLNTLDFNPNTEINNITDVKLVARAVTTGNKVYVKAHWARNLGFPIKGLAAANLKLAINGADNAIVGAITYSSTTEEYAITPTATLANGNTVLVTLNDATAGIEVAKVGAKFYSGYSNTAVSA